MDLQDAFYLNFNRRMGVMGLPAPSTLYGSLHLQTLGPLHHAYKSWVLKQLQLQGWAGDISKKLGMSIRDLFNSTLKAIPSTNPIRSYVCVAANKFAPEACRAPWLP